MASFINLALQGAANALLENYAAARDTPATGAFVKANGITGSAQLIASGAGARGVGVSSNAIDEGNYVLTTVPPSNNYFATVSLQILSTGNYFGIGLRANTTDRTRYSVDYNANGTVIVNKFPASGAGTQITTGTSGTGATSYAWNPVAGSTVHTIKAQVDGTTNTRIRAWVDGSINPVLDVTDSTAPITGAGLVSLHWYNITAPTDTTGILATALVADVPVAAFINLALVGAANALLENYTNTGDTPATGAFVKANGGTGSAQLIASGAGARGVGVSTSFFDEGNYVLTAVPVQADYFATVSLQILSTGNYFGIGLRANTTDRTRYSVDYNANGTVIVNKFPASGAGTQITTGTSGTGATSYAWNPVAGSTVHTIKAQVDGTVTPRIRVWIDGGANPVLDVTDSTAPITGAGLVSLHWYNITAPTDTTGILVTAFVAYQVVATPPAIYIPATVAGTVRSPGNWAQTGTGGLRSANPGAYLKTLWTGLTTMTLGIDISYNNPTYPPTVAWRWDGGAWTIAAVQPALNLTPTALTSGTHFLEVVYDASYSYGQDRWGPISGISTLVSSLTIAGYTPNGGAAQVACARKAKTILIYGDSITEGMRVNGIIAGGPAGGYGLETSGSDTLKGYASNLGLDAEVGIIGFGGSGVTVVGSGNVPVLATSYTSVYAGASRSLTDIFGDGTNKSPDAVLYVEGTNDTGNAEAGPLSTHTSGICTGLKSVITAIETVAPQCKHGVVSPFNGAHEVSTQAAVVQLNDPRVAWVSAATWANQAGDLNTDGIHPLAVTHVGKIAPRVADFAETVLNLGSVVGGTSVSRALRRGR